MGVNGRRFLYDGSMGMYHRGPLSPRWKTVTQKPDASLFSPPPLPPPGSPVSQPPSRCASVGAAVLVGLGDGWTSSNLTAAISVTAKKRSNNRGEVEIKLCFFGGLFATPQRKWHHRWSHLFILAVYQWSSFLSGSWCVRYCDSRCKKFKCAFLLRER